MQSMIKCVQNVHREPWHTQLERRRRQWLLQQSLSVLLTVFFTVLTPRIVELEHTIIITFQANNFSQRYKIIVRLMRQQIRLCVTRVSNAQTAIFSRIYWCHLVVHGPGSVVRKRSRRLSQRSFNFIKVIK